MASPGNLVRVATQKICKFLEKKLSGVMGLGEKAILCYVAPEALHVKMVKLTCF